MTFPPSPTLRLSVGELLKKSKKSLFFVRVKVRNMREPREGEVLTTPFLDLTSYDVKKRQSHPVG